jgi:hypothetical protein
MCNVFMLGKQNRIFISNYGLCRLCTFPLVYILLFVCGYGKTATKRSAEVGVEVSINSIRRFRPFVFSSRCSVFHSILLEVWRGCFGDKIDPGKGVASVVDRSTFRPSRQRPRTREPSPFCDGVFPREKFDCGSHHSLHVGVASTQFSGVTPFQVVGLRPCWHMA